VRDREVERREPGQERGEQLRAPAAAELARDQPGDEDGRRTGEPRQQPERDE